MMSKLSPMRSPDGARLAVLKAELEDLDYVLGSPSTTPVKTIPTTVMPLSSSVRDNYETTLAENAHVRRQVQYLSRELPSVRRSLSPGRGIIAVVEEDAAKRRVEARIGSQSPRHHSHNDSSNLPLDQILIDEVKQRDIELDFLSKRYEILQKKSSFDGDLAKQAVALLKSGIANAPGNYAESSYALTAQNVLDILEDIRCDESLPGFDDRLRQRIDQYESARNRIIDARIVLDTISTPAERESKLLDVIASHELAAAASEGVKKQQTKKVMGLTKQLCDKQASQKRTEQQVDNKKSQLAAAHEALAQMTAQLAAVTDTTKEVSKLQEEKQETNEIVCNLKSKACRADHRISNLLSEVESLKKQNEKLVLTESKVAELGEQNVTMGQDVHSLRSVAEEQEKQVMQLQEELRSKMSSVSTLEEELTKTRHGLAVKTTESEALRKRLQETETGFVAESNSAAGLKIEFERSEDRVVTLTKELRESATEVESLSIRLRDMSASVDEANLGLATTDKAYAKIKTDNFEFRESNKGLQLETQRAQRDASEANRKLGEVSRTLDELKLKMAEKEALASIEQDDQHKRDMENESVSKSLRDRELELEGKERGITAREIEIRQMTQTISEREHVLLSMEKELSAKRQQLGHTQVDSAISESKNIELTQLLSNRENETNELRREVQMLSEANQTFSHDRRLHLEQIGQLEHAVTIVRSQLEDNTIQFNTLTDDLQSTRDKYDHEVTQHRLLEDQLRMTTDVNTETMVQNKNIDADNSRLTAANEILEATLSRKNDQIEVLKSERDHGMEELTKKLIEANTIIESLRVAEECSVRNEKRAEQSQQDAISATDMLKTVQRELIVKQAQVDDVTRNSSNLWSAIARLGKKFDEYEKLHHRSDKPVHDRFEEASSFLRYIRGWWSMYKNKDPSLAFDSAIPPPALAHLPQPTPISNVLSPIRHIIGYDETVKGLTY